MIKTIACPNCNGEITVTTADLGAISEGVEDAARVVSARAMVDLKHVVPCHDFLGDPFAVLLHD